MRKAALLFLILFSTSLFAQNDDWRRGERDRDRRDDRDTPSDSAFELTPFVGYRWGGTIFASETFLFDEDVDVASSADLGVTFGIPLGDTGMKLELMANRQSSELETSNGLFDPNVTVADIDITYLHAGLQVPFARSRNVVPYAVVSAGVAHLDPQLLAAQQQQPPRPAGSVVAVNGIAPGPQGNLSDENRFSASAGIGVKIPMNRALSLRLEGRGYYTQLEDDRRDCSFCSYRYNKDFYQGEVNVGLTFSF